MADRRGERWYGRLLEAITAAQSEFVSRARPGPLFDGLLSALLRLANSEYGFIGEVLHTSEGHRYLKTHAITNIAWNEETQRFYEENAPQGLEFSNLDTLFGEVITTEAPVIANSPETDPRRGGLPKGHPPLNAFLGLPLHSGGSMVGMVGISNRSGGYDEQLVRDLKPFLQTCASAIFGLRAELRRREALAQLEDERSRMHGMLDGVFDAVLTIDEKGIVESISPSFERIFGYTADEICGHNVALLLPESTQSRHEEYVLSYVATGQPDIMGGSRDLVARRKNGTGFTADIRVTEISVQGRRLFTAVVRDLSDQEEAAKQIQSMRVELERNRFGQMVGSSPPMQQLYREIGEVAAGDWTVLIEGETGAGKELVARALHAASPRNRKPFIAVNLAGLTDSILGSQLFGHRHGAFTGAVRDHKGFFEAADGGTLFLDEIGDVSQSVQATLLRVLENGEIVRVGDSGSRKVDVRVIAATNRDLVSMVDSGDFRRDLYYRLCVARLSVPTLRRRREDVPHLAEAFLAEARVAIGKTITDFSPAALHLLSAYEWPGNVRELRNAIRFATMHCKTSMIGLGDLPPEVAEIEAPSLPNLKPSTTGGGPDPIDEALQRTGGNRTKAAFLLGISRATLYRRLKKR